MKTVRIFLFILTLVAGLAPAVQAAETAKPKAADASKPKVDPKAQAVVKSYSKYIGDLKSFGVKMTMVSRVEMAGIKVDMTVKSDTAVKRPNKFASNTVGSGPMGGAMMNTNTVSDGKKLYSYMGMANAYTEADAPKTLEELARNEEMAGADSSSIGDILLAPNSKDSAFQNLESAEYAGSEQIDGVKCDHVRLTISEEAASGMPAPKMDCWIESGDRPLLRRLIPDMAATLARLSELGKMPETPAGGPSMKDMKMEMTMNFADWQVNPDLGDEKFAFKAPEGAKKVDDMMSAMQEKIGALGGSKSSSESGAHPLEGKPAPAFKLKLAGGGEFDVAAQKGKKIVILDFWATWCGPCKKGLPVVTKVSEDYKSKDVVFVAVDESEQESVVTEFLKKQNLNIQAALDDEGKVGEQYGVEGIPQTVIIGKDGIVHKVHVGFMPSMDADLRKELDALIAK